MSIVPPEIPVILIFQLTSAISSSRTSSAHIRPTTVLLTSSILLIISACLNIEFPGPYFDAPARNICILTLNSVNHLGYSDMKLDNLARLTATLSSCSGQATASTFLTPGTAMLFHPLNPLDTCVMFIIRLSETRAL